MAPVADGPSLGHVYRFLLTPRWILSHLFVLVVCVTMIALGFWQLGRLDEKRTQNAQIESAMVEPAQPIDRVLPAGPATTPEQVAAAEYRPVVVVGTYRVDEQVLIMNRTYNSVPGYWVVTPLVQADGTAVVVLRGWIPFSYSAGGSPDDFAPPPGIVAVQGLVRPSQERSTNALVSSPKDPDTGVLGELARLDVGRLAQQIDERTMPAYVQLVAQDPPVGALPTPLDLPELSEGPHLGYAFQWFAFTLLTLIVYPLLVRRVARQRAAERVEASPEVA